MATAQHNVIIEFQSDFSDLQPALDILEKTGKVDAELAATFRKTNTEINRQGQALDKVAKQGNQSNQTYAKLNQTVQNFTKNGMGKLVVSATELAAAGIKAETFFKKIDPKEVTPKITTLRQELKSLKDQMQQAALSGGVLGEEYLRLKKRAGQLDDTIRDVGNDIRNAGSDTRGIDNVVGSISALAGGFSAVQGAAALFGDESEDLQKALLRVNAAMALATGLQQVSNALTKQGSLTRIADATATGFQVVAQKLYDATLKGSIVSLKAFKIALASTGIGLLIVGVTALIGLFGGASRATKALKKDLEDLRSGVDIAVEEIRREGETTVLLLEEAGAAQSKISKERLSQLLAVQEKEEGGLLALDATRTRLKEQLRSDNLAEISFALKGLKLVEEQEVASNAKLSDIRNQLRDDKIKIRTQETDENKKAEEKRAEDAKTASEKQKQLNEKALADARKLRLAEFDDYQAGIELKLLAAEKGSADELKLQKDLMRAKMMIDLEAEGLTNNQRKLLVQQFFKDRNDLYKKYNNDLVSAGLADEKSRLSAQLENLNLSEKEKLDVKISFLQISAAQEIAEGEKTAAQLRAINAKLNADISAAKIESIRKTSEQEARITAAINDPSGRALARVAQDEKLKADIRINAIKQLADREREAINQRIIANRAANDVIGADHKELNILHIDLLNEYVAASEKSEQDITAITKGENDKRKADKLAAIQATIQGLQQIGDVIATINHNEQEAIQNQISIRRRELDDLVRAGAITEKEADRRNKKLDAEDRAAKMKAAKQVKNLAVFQALLAIPQAYLAGLQTPLIGAIIGPIYAAIAAAQAALVIARPLPQFATGKKGSYKGLGIAGEVGAELIERADGSMEVATKRSLVYLGSQDKVFTAGETKKMLPQVNREVMSGGVSRETFDYNKMAKAMGKSSSTTVNIDKEFISESVADGLSKVNYFDRYYNSKG